MGTRRVNAGRVLNTVPRSQQALRACQLLPHHLPKGLDPRHRSPGNSGQTDGTGGRVPLPVTQEDPSFLGTNHRAGKTHTAMWEPLSGGCRAWTHMWTTEPGLRAAEEPRPSPMRVQSPHRAQGLWLQITWGGGPLGTVMEGAHPASPPCCRRQQLSLCRWGAGARFERKAAVEGMETRQGEPPCPPPKSSKSSENYKKPSLLLHKTLKKAISREQKTPGNQKL